MTEDTIIFCIYLKAGLFKIAQIGVEQLPAGWQGNGIREAILTFGVHLSTLNSMDYAEIEVDFYFGYFHIIDDNLLILSGTKIYAYNNTLTKILDLISGKVTVL